MEQQMIFYIGLAILGLLLVVAAAIRSRGKEPDYRTYFLMGLIWTPVGLLFNISLFYILGPIYLLWGLVNRDKWGKTRRELHSNSQTNQL